MKKYMLVVLMVVLLLALSVSVASAKGDTYGGNYHTVSYGETLFSIGRYYGVNPYSIARANNLYNPNYIYAGQVLYIPAGYQQPGPPSCGDGSGVYHTVRRGETLTMIAYRYGTSVWSIAQANNIYNPNRIYSGQVLYIPYSGGNNCGCYQDCGCNQDCGTGYYPRPGHPIYNPPVPQPYY
jgi:LysM repeat protein